MKYIVFNETEVFLFPSPWDHDLVKQMVQSQRPGLVPTSAGFVNTDEVGEVFCHRYSHSLNLKPHPGDQSLISRHLERQ